MKVQFKEKYVDAGMSFAAGDVAELDDDIAAKLKKQGVVGDYTPPKPGQTVPSTDAGVVAPAPAPTPTPAPVPTPTVEPTPTPAPLVQKGKK